jgi:hypothetical protein
MDIVWDLLGKCIDIISTGFSEHPFTAALLTFGGAATIYYIYEKTEKTPAEKHALAFGVVIAWATAVAIVGTLLGVIGWIWNFLAGIAGFLWSVLEFFWESYHDHPFLVLALIGIGVAVFLVWHWRFRSSITRNVYAKATLVIAACVLSMGAIVPVLNAFKADPGELAAPSGQAAEAEPQRDTGQAAPAQQGIEPVKAALPATTPQN